MKYETKEHNSEICSFLSNEINVECLQSLYKKSNSLDLLFKMTSISLDLIYSVKKLFPCLHNFFKTVKYVEKIHKINYDVIMILAPTRHYGIIYSSVILLLLNSISHIIYWYFPCCLFTEQTHSWCGYLSDSFSVPLYWFYYASFVTLNADVNPQHQELLEVR